MLPQIQLTYSAALESVLTAKLHCLERSRPGGSNARAILLRKLSARPNHRTPRGRLKQEVGTTDKLIGKTVFETTCANRLLMKFPTAWKRKITGQNSPEGSFELSVLILES